MDRLLSLLPTGPRAVGARGAVAAAAAAAIAVPPLPPPSAPAPLPEDLAVQEAINVVLEYHRTHRPKNTARNYGPKQKEWKVSPVLLELADYPKLGH
jgi:hypothetical protein